MNKLLGKIVKCHLWVINYVVKCGDGIRTLKDVD